MAFPLPFIPKQSWKDGDREFGSERDAGRRLHAGCDLYAPVGTPIYSVADGKIIEFGDFYRGTRCIVIDHDDFIVRYGEIQDLLPQGIKVGSLVKANTEIGKVACLKGVDISMLHFEMYKGFSSGPLTNKRNPPYQRRPDLMDPTGFLERCALELVASLDRR
jgi:murein DD-endopeptidase MepM/ murein hydrolase activator NlpD